MQFSSNSAKLLKTFQIQRDSSNKEFWKRLGSFDFDGKKVLDLGCGAGAMSLDIVEKGASEVVGIDIDEGRVNFANNNISKNFPNYSSRISFRSISLAEISVDAGFSDKFDVVVSKDAFEHIDNLPEVMRQIAAILNKDGVLLTGFGPLYFSPFGDHGRYLNHKTRKVPWLPLIPEFMLFRLVSGFHTSPIRSAGQLGLNKLKPKDFREIIYDQGWNIKELNYNRGERAGMKLMRWLRMIPMLESLFTVNIYAHLERPELNET